MKEKFKLYNLKLLIGIIGLIIFEAFVFFLTKPFIQNPFVLGSNLDNKIPFIPEFIWIYVFWYIMLLIVPYYIAKKNNDSFFKYAATFIISTTIAGIIFVAFPNTVIRANIQGNDLSSKLVRVIYMLDDPGINCLPSIHCLFSYLFIFSIFDTKDKTPVYIKIIITILSVLVVLSTLFIKQHVVYDAIAAFAIASIIWIIVDELKIYNFIKKVFKNKMV